MNELNSICQQKLKRSFTFLKTKYCIDIEKGNVLLLFKINAYKNKIFVAVKSPVSLKLFKY